MDIWWWNQLFIWGSTIRRSKCTRNSRFARYKLKLIILRAWSNQFQASVHAWYTRVPTVPTIRSGFFFFFIFFCIFNLLFIAYFFIHLKCNGRLHVSQIMTWNEWRRNKKYRKYLCAYVTMYFVVALNEWSNAETKIRDDIFQMLCVYQWNYLF